MDHEMKYRIADARRTRKLRQCTNVADPTDLRAELGAARLLAQEALDQGQIPLANAILAAIGKLSHSQVAVMRMKSEYLERGVVLRIGLQLVEILGRAVEGKFPNWEQALSQAADEVTKAVAVATNEKPQTLEEYRE